MDAIKIGLVGEQSVVADQTRSARHLGSGGVDVFATPAMIQLMEGAAVAAIDHLLSDGQASVGVSVNIQHLAATPLGQTIRAEAKVTEISGKKVTFRVQAWDEYELIGEGEHVRFVIDLSRYTQRLKKKI